MKKSVILARMLAAGIALTITGGAPAWGHHSFAMYDGSKQYVFTGIVVRIAPNPDHQQIYFVPLNEERTAIVRNAAGDPFVWMMEMEGSAQAALQGVTVEAFPPGTIISTGLLPLRNGQPAGTRGQEAGQTGASVIFQCPGDTAPAAGLHCDTVEGATTFGEGTALPEPTSVWTP